MFRCDFKIQNKIIDDQFVDTNSKLNLVFAVFFCSSLVFSKRLLGSTFGCRLIENAHMTALFICKNMRFYCTHRSVFSHNNTSRCTNKYTRKSTIRCGWHTCLTDSAGTQRISFNIIMTAQRVGGVTTHTHTNALSHTSPMQDLGKFST